MALYTIGNLIMLRLINVVAIVFFDERVSATQGLGLLLVVIAVALITLGPAKGKS